MKTFLSFRFGVVVAMTLAAFTAAGNGEPEKMISLFDGRTLDGWIQDPADAWMVNDGAMASKGIGRGVIYTKNDYSSYRIIFTMRHLSGDHEACVLFFCTRPPGGQKGLDALGGIQFRIPGGNSWDYRPGRGNDGGSEFKALPHPNFNSHEWSQIEILIDAKTGTARMAVAQPVGSKAVEILDFNDPTAATIGPFALQMHNKGLFDEYKDIKIEVDPKDDELITVK